MRPFARPFASEPPLHSSCSQRHFIAGLQTTPDANREVHW